MSNLLKYQIWKSRSFEIKDLVGFTIKSQEENISKIIIENQNIPVLSKSLFEIDKEITTLHIFQSNIKKIEEDVFMEQEITEHVTITKNQISIIKTKTFKNLKLTVLVLDRNEIEVLENESFFNLTNLLDLRLQYNKLTILNQFAFYQLPNLKVLDLSYNRIDVLDPENLIFIKQDNFTFIMSHNRIFKLNSDLFKCFKKDYLNFFLDFNFLETLSDGIFNNRTFVWLIFTSNPLRNISKNICDETCTIKDLSIDKKCLENYCNEEFFEWAKMKGIIVKLHTHRNNYSNQCKKLDFVVLIIVLFVTVYFRK